MRTLFNKFRGWRRSKKHLSSPWVRLTLEGIACRVASTAAYFPKKKACIMTVGFSKSGKETLILSHPRLASYFRISTDPIHEQLNEAFEFLQDKKTVEGPAYWERQILTSVVRDMTLPYVLELGAAVVLDSCNLNRAERLKRLRLAAEADYETQIIWVRCSEHTLIERLVAADKRKREAGEDEAWMDLYFKVQQRRLQPPQTIEAKRVDTYWSDRNDPLPEVL